MKTSLVLISIAFLAACSDDSAPEQSTATPPPPPAAQASAPADKADVAVLEAAEPQAGVDPCDLSGYDMSKMTADLHEDLVKACEKSKQ